MNAADPASRYRPMNVMILTVCNSFCWQTALEILASVEYLDENVSPNSFAASISKLLKAGKLVSRPTVAPSCGVRNRGRLPLEYILSDAGFPSAPTTRRCLGCSKPFPSEGIHNRLCAGCSGRQDESPFEAAAVIHVGR